MGAKKSKPITTGELSQTNTANDQIKSIVAKVTTPKNIDNANRETQMHCTYVKRVDVYIEVTIIVYRFIMYQKVIVN